MLTSCLNTGLTPMSHGHAITMPNAWHVLYCFTPCHNLIAEFLHLLLKSNNPMILNEIQRLNIGIFNCQNTQKIILVTLRFTGCGSGILLLLHYILQVCNRLYCTISDWITMRRINIWWCTNNKNRCWLRSINTTISNMQKKLKLDIPQYFFCICQIGHTSVLFLHVRYSSVYAAPSTSIFIISTSSYIYPARKLFHPK